MQDPSASPSAFAAPPAPSEIVHAPDRGTLAAGRWEAPVSAFYFGGGIAVLAAIAYLLYRLGAARGARKT